MDGKLQIGAVNYLNTKPLIQGLDQLAPWAHLVLDLPSRLADRLATGELDVALIPVVEFFQRADYRIVSDACIGCRGPVLSVKLFFRTPPEQVRTLALDEGSRTSAALARILLEQRYGLRPQLERLPIGSSLEDTTADAVLLIGDRAMHSPLGRFEAVWDLGDEWNRWAELPFVFAVWVARAGIEPEQLHALEQALAAARDQGVAQLTEIARREAHHQGLSQPECLAYLRDYLHFYLGPGERQGLALYYRLATKLGLAPEGVDLGCPDYRAVG